MNCWTKAERVQRHIKTARTARIGVKYLILAANKGPLDYVRSLSVGRARERSRRDNDTHWHCVAKHADRDGAGCPGAIRNAYREEAVASFPTNDRIPPAGNRGAVREF